MIRTVLRLYPKDKDCQGLVPFHQRGFILERATEQDVLVTATRDSLAAHQGWVNDPWRQISAGELSRLLGEDLPGTTSGQVYDIAHTVTRAKVDAQRSAVRGGRIWATARRVQP